MKKALFLLLIGISVAHAETQSAESRALTLRIGQEVNASLQCSTQAFILQDKLAAAEAEVKRLTDKYEPKKEDDPAK